MIRTLIIAFPYGANIPHIFQMALILIEANLKEKHDLIVLKLYHFICMEVHEGLNLLPAMQKLLTSNWCSLIEDLDLQNMPYILLIIEEHVLLNLIPYNQYPGLIQLIDER